MKDNQDHFEILRTLNKNPKSSQRELANKLGFSLGKLNYCINGLKEKGLLKINNFKKNPNKLGYIYKLTPKGINHILHYIRKKMREYDELEKEIKK